MRARRSLIAVLLGLQALASSSHAETDRRTSSFPTLRESRDASLQRALAAKLSALGVDELVRAERLAVALVGLSKLDRPRVASVNGEVMMYAASLPKLAILLTAFERAADGALVLDSSTELELTDMIRKSSNRAASRMIERVGGEQIARTLQAPKYRLYDPSFGGGLWVGKEYGKGAAFRRDPLHQLSHGATAMQTARFYYLLATDRLVSREASLRMRSMLSKPALTHKFVKGLRSVRPQSKFYRKSGTWRNWHSDSALIEYDDKRYIAVALAEAENGEAILQKLIVALDEVITENPPEPRAAGEAPPAGDAAPR